MSGSVGSFQDSLEFLKAITLSSANTSLLLVQPRKTGDCPNMSEILWMGRNTSTQKYHQCQTIWIQIFKR